MISRWKTKIKSTAMIRVVKEMLKKASFSKYDIIEMGILVLIIAIMLLFLFLI